MKSISFRWHRNYLFRMLLCGILLGSAEGYAVSSTTTYLSSLQQTASGTVSDANGPLPGVSISVKGKPETTVSDAEGHFSLQADTGDIIQFSFMGYAMLERTFTGNSLSVTLLPEASTIQEVVVNAGYYRVKDKERTGNIAKITSKEIETQPVTNVLATMQGRMAGVHIVQNTGVPGGGFDIQIRGLNSVRATGNNPLYIIDGVPYASDPIGSGQNSTVLPGRPSPLNSINPNQVESIEVLKDADATAIYGSRGANGVVLITTKTGKKGKTRFSAQFTTGTGTVTRFMDLLSTEQYLEMRREAFVNDGVQTMYDFAYDINGIWDQNRSTNWQKELLGKASYLTELQASASGGTDQTQFLITANLNRQTTVFPGSWNYAKGNVLLNVNHASEDKRFQSTFSVGYTAQNNLQPRTDLMLTALSLPANAPRLRDDQGEINWEGSTWNNPLGDLIPEYTAKTYDLLTNALLSYELLKNVKAKSSFGYAALNNDEWTTIPSTKFDPIAGLGAEVSSLIAGRASRKSWIVEPQIEWGDSFGKLSAQVLTGATFQSQYGTQNAQIGTGFSSNSLINNLASAAAIVNLSSEETRYNYQAFFGRVNLNWDGRYILNITGRRDGSSRFGPGKQFANFGAIGGAWLFSREKVWGQNSVLSFGKLRASYGITGNDQIGDYQFFQTYASTNNNYDGVIGIQPTRLYNPNYGWETNKKAELGLELGLFNDRLFATAAWYRNRSGNQLTGMPLPGTTGFTSMQVNLNAVVENTGSEFTLRSVNFQKRQFDWTTSVNLTFAKNRLLSFPDLESSTYRNLYAIGQPLNIARVYKYLGVDPQTGLYSFEDVNKDGKLTVAEDRTTVKDLNPKFFGGLHNQMNYKQWQLSFLFQFVKQLNYNQSVFFNAPGTMSQQPASVIDRWQQPGDRAQHQLYTDGSNAEAMEAYDRYITSDAVITDASYIRLKNLSISYTLPDQMLKGFQCRLVAEGQNLLTFTNYKGADPEFSSAGYLPPLKVMTLGVHFTF